jgi:hypothetical protein
MMETFFDLRRDQVSLSYNAVLDAPAALTLFAPVMGKGGHRPLDDRLSVLDVEDQVFQDELNRDRLFLGVPDIIIRFPPPG